jgi:hypothetical protein
VKLTWTLVALRAATEPTKEEAMQDIVEEWLCGLLCLCVLENDDRERACTAFILSAMMARSESSIRPQENVHLRLNAHTARMSPKISRMGCRIRRSNENALRLELVDFLPRSEF